MKNNNFIYFVTQKALIESYILILLSTDTHSFHLMNSGNVSCCIPYWSWVMAFMSKLSNSTSFDRLPHTLNFFCQATGFWYPSTNFSVAGEKLIFPKSWQMVVDGSITARSSLLFAMSVYTSFPPKTLRTSRWANRKVEKGKQWLPFLDFQQIVSEQLWMKMWHGELWNDNYLQLKPALPDRRITEHYITTENGITISEDNNWKIPAPRTRRSILRRGILIILCSIFYVYRLCIGVLRAIVFMNNN